jgi:hypothetical protein
MVVEEYLKEEFKNKTLKKLSGLSAIGVKARCELEVN